MLKKLFNKCILINKWYHKTIVLIIGPRPQPPVRPPSLPAAAAVRERARPVRPRSAHAHACSPPAPARSACSRLLGWALLRPAF